MFYKSKNIFPSIPSTSFFFKRTSRKNFSTTLNSLRQGRRRDFYQILGVHRSAKLDDIKSAFYMLSKKYHPDVAGSDMILAQKFLEIREAYDTLKDEEKRRDYDRRLSLDRANGMDQLYSKRTYSNEHNSCGTSKHWSQKEQEWNQEILYKYAHARRKTKKEPYSNTSDDDLYWIWRVMQREKTESYRQRTDEFYKNQAEQERKSWERDLAREWYMLYEQQKKQDELRMKERKNHTKRYNRILIFYLVVIIIIFLL